MIIDGHHIAKYGRLPKVDGALRTPIQSKDLDHPRRSHEARGCRRVRTPSVLFASMRSSFGYSPRSAPKVHVSSGILCGYNDRFVASPKNRGSKMTMPLALHVKNHRVVACKQAFLLVFASQNPHGLWRAPGPDFSITGLGTWICSFHEHVNARSPAQLHFYTS
jgi:hypothetical protein